MSPENSPEKLTARVAGKKDKIVVEIDETEKLPPGWKKEMRIRKSGSLTKVDRFYTDPVTGYIFRSLRDAQRYLKTGKLGRLAIKPKKEFVDMDNKDERLHMKELEERSESKEQMSEALKRKRPLDNTISKYTETGESKLLQRASKPKQMAVDSLPPSPIVSELKTHQTSRLTDIIVDTPLQPSPLPPEPKTQQANRVSGITDNASSLSPKLVNLATSKYNDKQTEAYNITNKHTENADMDNNINNNQQETIITIVNHESDKEIKVKPSTWLTTKDQATSTINNRIKISVENLWSDPCMEFAIKTLTGEIPFGDLDKFEKVWTDPCIEFAEKTLTDAGEDCYLLPQPGSNRNPRAPYKFHSPDTGMSFCQKDVLSKRFETGQNLAFGRGGLQNSGNISFRDPGSFSKF